MYKEKWGLWIEGDLEHPLLVLEDGWRIIANPFSQSFYLVSIDEKTVWRIRDSEWISLLAFFAQ